MGNNGAKPCAAMALPPLDNIRPEQHQQPGSIWKLSTAVIKGTNTPCTVFVAQRHSMPCMVSVRSGNAEPEFYESLAKVVKGALRPPASLRDVVSCAADAIQRIRTLRHPSILHLLGCSIPNTSLPSPSPSPTAPSGPSSSFSPSSSSSSLAHNVAMVTESAQSLRQRLNTKGVTWDEICCGVVAIARALEWLHTQCDMAYNNVCVDGVYVVHNPVCQWVLGDFSFACPRDAEDLCRHAMALQVVVAPEDAFGSPPDASPKQRRRSCGSPVTDLATRDIYGLGCLIDQLVLWCVDHQMSLPESSRSVEAMHAHSLRRQLLPTLVQDVVSDELELCAVSSTPLTPRNPAPRTAESAFEERGGHLATPRTPLRVSPRLSPAVSMNTHDDASASSRSGVEQPPAPPSGNTLTVPVPTTQPHLQQPADGQISKLQASEVVEFEERLAGRGLEALLGEVASEIEWLKRDCLPPKMRLLTHSPSSVRALNSGEELVLWSLRSLHRSPSSRPTLAELITGRHVSESPLVRTSVFLKEQVHGAPPEVRREGYSDIVRLIQECSYDDVVEFIIPLVCERSLFVDPLTDPLYEMVLRPKGLPSCDDPYSIVAPHQDTTSHSEIDIGSIVETTSPSSARGRIVGASSDLKTYTVELEEHGVVDLPAESITPVHPALHTFVAGMTVQASGLQRSADLNGQQGVVAGVDPVAGRVLVIFEEARGQQRALKPDNLQVVHSPIHALRPTAESSTKDEQQVTPPKTGVLAIGDYMRLIVPFITQALTDKVDGDLRIALLYRLPLWVGCYDYPFLMNELVPQVALCLSDADDDICSGACMSVPPLCGAVLSKVPKPSSRSPKQVKAEQSALQRLTDQLVTPLYYLFTSPSSSVRVRQVAIQALLLLWDLSPVPGKGVVVSALSVALHDNNTEVVTASLGCLPGVVGGINPGEVVGVLVPLLSPLTIHPIPDVRSKAHAALSTCLTALRLSKPSTAFPTPPTPQSLAVHPKPLKEPFQRKARFKRTPPSHEG